MAKLQEAAIRSRRSRNLIPNPPPILPKNPTTFQTHPPNYKRNPPLLPTPPGPFPKPPPFKPRPQPYKRTLTPYEFDEKRAKGICFWCHEKSEPIHRCRGRKPQLYHVEIHEDGEENSESEDHTEEEATIELAHISLHALAGTSTFQTMRVKGHHSRKSLHLLLDSGCSHNFIDTNLVAKLGCKIYNVTSMWVKVADGGKIVCDAQVKGFSWTMQLIVVFDSVEPKWSQLLIVGPKQTVLPYY